MDGTFAGRVDPARPDGDRGACLHHHRSADPGAAAAAHGAGAAARPGRPDRRRRPAGGRAPRSASAGCRPRPRGATGRQVVSAFYVPWDEASPASLAAHVNELDWVIPAAAFVTGPDHQLRVAARPAFDAIIAGAQRRPLVLPMVQNAAERPLGRPRHRRPAARPARAARTCSTSSSDGGARHGAGIVFDFEEIPAAGQRDYLRFLAEANRRFDAARLDASRWRRRSAIPTGTSPLMPASPTRSS